MLRAHYGDDAGAGAALRLGEQLERAAAAADAAAAAEIDSDDEAEDERGAEEPIEEADSDDEVPAASRAEARRGLESATPHRAGRTRGRSKQRRSTEHCARGTACMCARALV